MTTMTDQTHLDPALDNYEGGVTFRYQWLSHWVSDSPSGAGWRKERYP